MRCEKKDANESLSERSNQKRRKDSRSKTVAEEHQEPQESA